MAELASSSGSPAVPVEKSIPVSVVSAAATATETAPVGEVSSSGELVEITDEDRPKCTNCKTCYQDLSELFEKTKIVVDGTAKEVSRVIPGIFDKIEITPELVQRAERVANDCDVEIIRFHPPA